LVLFDHRIVNDPALAGMNDARLGTFAASHLAGHQAYAAGTAVTGTTVIRQVDAVVQRRIQQHLAATRQKAMTIDRNMMTSCHSLIPEG
jgi:hypothetical protein